MGPQAIQENRPDEATDGDCNPLLGLTGRRLPRIVLPSTTHQSVLLSELDRAVVYVYPGTRCSPEDGYDSPALDEVQHRSFADHWSDFLALTCSIVGISSRPLEDQSVDAATLGLGHPLLFDSRARVARQLGLPIFMVNAVEWYCRGVIIINDGAIVKVFYPLTSVVQSPAQAIAWMRRQRWS